MTTFRWLVLFLLAGLISAFFVFDLGALLTLENIKAEQTRLTAVLDTRPLLFPLVFFAIYVAVTALSIPGAALMTLIAGALFGFWWGLLLVSFASSTGATLAMLIARWLFKEQVERRFRRQLAVINKGIEREGAFYLFALRLVPIFPFFAINLVMSLTRMSVPVFYLVSQLGMLAGTAVYINAGTQLGQVEAAGDILSPLLITSFVLLGIFPLATKKLLDRLRAGRVYRGYDRPRTFDRDLIVIGAGSGGLVSALIATTVEAKVTLIEKKQDGWRLSAHRLRPQQDIAALGPPFCMKIVMVQGSVFLIRNCRWT